MNLDELVKSIPNKERKLKQSLADFVNHWKANDQSIDELANLIDRWHGNVWFESKDVSNQFYKDFSMFREQAISGIGGMTINERLYWFGLFDLWESGNSERKNIIMRKLNVKAS